MQVQEQTTQTPKTEVTKLSQKDAVYNFVNEALKADGLGDKYKLEQGTALKTAVSKDVRKVVRQRLFVAVKSGEVKCSKQFDDSKLKKYCSGLINNWLKKDPRFN